MNCKEVGPLLTAYLDDEVGASERVLIQAHLAGCQTCRHKLADVARLRDRLSQSLRARGFNAALPADSWERLQVRLAAQHAPQHAPQRGPQVRPRVRPRVRQTAWPDQGWWRTPLAPARLVLPRPLLALVLFGVLALAVIAGLDANNAGPAQQPVSPVLAPLVPAIQPAMLPAASAPAPAVARTQPSFSARDVTGNTIIAAVVRRAQFVPDPERAERPGIEPWTGLWPGLWPANSWLSEVSTEPRSLTGVGQWASQ